MSLRIVTSRLASQGLMGSAGRLVSTAVISQNKRSSSGGTEASELAEKISKCMEEHKIKEGLAELSSKIDQEQASNSKGFDRLQDRLTEFAHKLKLELSKQDELTQLIKEKDALIESQNAEIISLKSKISNLIKKEICNQENDQSSPYLKIQGSSFEKSKILSIYYERDLSKKTRVYIDYKQGLFIDLLDAFGISIEKLSYTFDFDKEADAIEIVSMVKKNCPHIKN